MVMAASASLSSMLYSPLSCFVYKIDRPHFPGISTLSMLGAEFLGSLLIINCRLVTVHDSLENYYTAISIVTAMTVFVSSHNFLLEIEKLVPGSGHTAYCFHCQPNGSDHDVLSIIHETSIKRSNVEQNLFQIPFSGGAMNPARAVGSCVITLNTIPDYYWVSTDKQKDDTRNKFSSPLTSPPTSPPTNFLTFFF